MRPDSRAGYLAKRGIRGPWRLDLEPGRPLSGAVIIPALAESASLPALVESLRADHTFQDSGLAVVFVVNHREDAPAGDRADNRVSLELLRHARETLPFAIGIIDAASPGLELPLKEGGVGFARKLGHDLVLSLLDCDAADPLLVSLDADTLVSPGYAAAVTAHFRESAAGGAIIPYEHQPGRDDDENGAIQRYELFLRCYVAGLAYAGSPYAFNTLGSAMACRASAYLKCGGMNRRRAGEDFYFLQELAKTAGVAQVAGTCVYPSARRSSRVPFGTGRAMTAMLGDEMQPPLFYRPECFVLLKQWLALAEWGCRDRSADLPARAERLSPVLGRFLAEQRFSAAWQGFAAQHPAPERRSAAFHQWFDAFRTMKFCHFLADDILPRTGDAAVLDGLPEAWGGAGLSVSERLALLRRVQVGDGRF